MKLLIESNAAKLRTLHEAIHAAWLRRNHDEAANKKWRQACRDFHESFDNLAFPGGLSRAMGLLAKNDSDTIEQAVRFLEADPFFHRSGYIKADLIRHLRHRSLNTDQKIRLQRVIIERIHEKGRREFRWYCRLAKSITDPQFELQITNLATQKAPELISRQARWVLNQLKAAQ